MTPDNGTPDNDQLLRQYLHYRTRIARRRWSDRTSTLRVQQLERTAREIAPATLADATEEDLLAWYARIPGGPSNQAGFASALHGLYQWMCVYARPRLRVDDPSVLLECPVVPDVKPRPMLSKRYDLALACALGVDPELYVMLLLMGCCGLRCCEVAWLQVNNVDDRGGGGMLVDMLGKRGKRRNVPVAEPTMACLRPFLRGRGAVFTREHYDGSPYTPNKVSRRVNDFLHGVGLAETAHQLRHRFGTDYRLTDPDAFRQARLMGHESTKMTLAYTEVDPEEAVQYIERVTRQRVAARAGAGHDRRRAA